MTKRQASKMVAMLKKHQVKIAKERDRVRDTLSEFEEIADNCDEAVEDIERAIEALSRFQ